MNLTRATFTRLRHTRQRPSFQLRKHTDGTYESIICCTGGVIRFYGLDEAEVYNRARSYELA
jgi:hypothetical protein